MGLIHEDGQPIVCHYCGEHIDFDDAEERWYHVAAQDDEEAFTCANDISTRAGDTKEAVPTCMWYPDTCHEAGDRPLQEEVRNRDTEEVIEENYLAFLCQRHLKIVAYMAIPDHIIPFQLLDPLVIEEMPG
jgi:hypothetical protein